LHGPEQSATDEEMELHRLRRRVMDLERWLVYVRNFLPAPLKKHVEDVLWPNRN